MSTPKILTPGDEVTIWPSVSRACGESYDTEPGAQPWKAKYLGTTHSGKLLIQDLSDKYPPREVDPVSITGPNYR